MVEVAPHSTDENRRVSFGEQRRNVIQLLKDRKNAYGGEEEGIKDFSEMGAHQSEHWPLSAESIKRKFGTPKRGEDQSDAQYFEHIRAASHQMIEVVMYDYLRRVAPEAFICLNNIFSADNSGDNDWENLVAAAKEVRTITQKQWDRMTELERANTIYAQKRALERQHAYLQCEAGITLITHFVWHVNLFVEYARRRTKEEDESNEQKNNRIYVEYKNLTNPQPEGKGMPSKKAYRELHRDWGVSVSRLEQIVASQRQLVEGLPPRRQGRPKKGER